MNRLFSYSLDYYNKSVITRIIEKYNLDEMEAARRFLTSETHNMLEDANLSMWDFPEYQIFDMWETEQATGDPRNSKYLREEYVGWNDFFLIPYWKIRRI